MGTVCQALDLIGLDLFDTWNRDGLLLGLLRIGLGRLVVLGPRRKCVADAMADGNGFASFHHRDGKARCIKSMDNSSVHFDIFAFAIGYFSCAFRRYNVSTFLCE